MTIDTIIFDLDGTLLYTLEDLTDSTNKTLRKFGYPERSINEIKNFVGNGVELLLKRSIPDGDLNPNYSSCIKTFKQIYSKNMFHKTKPYDGIIDLLKILKAKNYKIAVVSNKFDSAVNKICKRYFDKLIDYSIGKNENLAPKPAPDMILRTINILDKSAEECILVGDSEVDIQTANNSGIPCISVAWGYKSLEFLYKNGASMLVYSPYEILDLV